MKARRTGAWWPMNHWTNRMIEVHGLYCIIAVLLHGLLMRQIRAAGLNLSTERVLTELADIREVINVYPAKRKRTETRQTVLSRLNDVQQKLVNALGLNPEKNDF